MGAIRNLMAEPYRPHEIEQKWQQRWEQTRAYQVSEIPGKKKYYLLEMFPYDAGDTENVQRRIKSGLDRIYEEFKTSDRVNDLSSR
mgnify:CR=1 FL=1